MCLEEKDLKTGLDLNECSSGKPKVEAVAALLLSLACLGPW